MSGLVVTKITLAPTLGGRTRQFWNDSATVRWEVSASDPDDMTVASITFQIADAQKHRFPLGQRVEVPIEST